MPATTGMTTIGVVLRMGDGATPTEVFTAVANVVSVDMGRTAGEIDATHLGSTSGYKEFRQGFKTGSVDFEIHFDPDNTTHNDATGLESVYNAGTPTNFKLDLSAADNGGAGAPTTDPVATFEAVILDFSISAQVEDMVRASLSMRITGPVTWGAS